MDMKTGRRLLDAQASACSSTIISKLIYFLNLIAHRLNNILQSKPNESIVAQKSKSVDK